MGQDVSSPILIRYLGELESQRLADLADAREVVAVAAADGIPGNTELRGAVEKAQEERTLVFPV